MIAFDILTFYFIISSFFTKKNIEVNCVIVLFYYLGEKHSMNVKKNHLCALDVRYNLSNLCCLPPQKCVANLHDNSKSNMVAIVKKVYYAL